MNQIIVNEIVTQINRLNEIPEITAIVSQKKIQHFNANYLVDEFRKIESARLKDYPTYRSEYRVVKTLIRQRNMIIYYLNKNLKDFGGNDNVLVELVELSQLLNPLLKSIGDVFEEEKNIAQFAEQFDNSCM